ncbi:MAG: hypothetical protein RSA55_08780, partial [Clostridia bacterium]
SFLHSSSHGWDDTAVKSTFWQNKVPSIAIPALTSSIEICLKMSARHCGKKIFFGMILFGVQVFRHAVWQSFYCN